MEIGAFTLIMIGAIVVFVIADIICFIECYSWIPSAVLTLLFITSFVLMITASIKVDSTYSERSEEPYTTHELMCLNDTSFMTGRFYLRSGYIEEDLYYLYGYKTSSGGMKTFKVKDNIATIYFDDSVEPCAMWYHETKQWWFITSTSHSCDIYVPTDSLTADYAIDLQ